MEVVDNEQEWTRIYCLNMKCAVRYGMASIITEKPVEFLWEERSFALYRGSTFGDGESIFRYNKTFTIVAVWNRKCHWNFRWVRVVPLLPEDATKKVVRRPQCNGEHESSISIKSPLSESRVYLVAYGRKLWIFARYQGIVLCAYIKLQYQVNLMFLIIDVIVCMTNN